MVSEQDYPRQQLVWSDWAGWYVPNRTPNPFRSMVAPTATDRPYSSSASARRPWPSRSIASSSGSGASREARPVRPYFPSGYGSEPDRCAVKVPGIVPGKIPKPVSISGKMMESTVRYEAVAFDPTAIWRVVHLRSSQELSDLPDRVPPAELNEEKIRRTEDLRQLSLNDTQEIQSVSIPEGNLHFPSTDLSEVVTGWGEDPLPHDFIAFPHLNNLNPSHGPEMAKDMEKGGFGVDDRWLWSTGLLWNLPPWPDLSLCEADGMAIDIEKGAAAMCLRMAAMFGGIVGQEVVQACSGKFHSVYQFFYFDSIESLPVEPSESGDLKPENTRYTAQISVFGSKLQKKLEQAKIFTVGSGTLGCEVLKNLALMGISCSPDGKLTVTDDDVIEQSNISRQFLVHDWNSGQPKSTVAATIVMAINSKDYVEAQMLPKSHYCYLIRLTLEYCKFSSLDADEITKESRRRLSNSFGEIRYCFNDVGLLCASEAIKIYIERGQKRGWLKGASDATYQQSGANGLCLFAEISALHMKFFEEVLHLIVKRLQQGIEAFLNSESGCVGATKMGYIFQKLYELIQIFYSFCNFDHVRCLIFVNREIIAKIIERTMQKMGHLSHYKDGEFLQRENGGGISTDRISKILSNGCLVVNFAIKFIFGKVWSCLADPYEVEVVSFCKCEGIVKKHEHLEDFHWAVRPLLITIGIFVGKSITVPKGLKVASVSDQGGDHQQLHQQEVQLPYQCSMIPSTGGKHTFLRRSCAFWIKVNDGEFLKHLGYATPQIDPG